ncbi:MAG: tetratricopeptide repeat protein [Candidatus Aminicenantes bacterium]|nr:tetratricopeptide repeat protein [Candidatus Aminicenantes bacterium]
MKKALLGIFSILLLTAMVFPQAYRGRARVVGFVYDQSGNPIEGVTVKLYSIRAEDGFELKTNKNGKWVAMGIRGGGWNIDFEKIGYMPHGISIDVSSFGKNPDVEITMEKVEGIVLTDEIQEKLSAGNELFDAGKYEQAVQSYQKLLEENPELYIINQNIGNCYFQMEQYDKAIEYYKKIMEDAPEDADTNILSDAQLLVGKAYENKGDDEQALEWYRKIEFEEIDDPVVLYNIGTRLYNMANYEEALKYYQRSIEVKDDFLDGLYQLGLTYLTLGKNEQAIVQFEEYLKIDPDSERANQVQGFLDYLRR